MATTALTMRDAEDAQPAGATTRAAQHVGLLYALRRTPGGEVGLEAVREHRLKIHTGAPVTGHCGASRFAYTRGDVDFIPAGMAESWREDGPSTSLVLSLSPQLLRRAAEDMGRDPARLTLAPRHQFRDPRIEHIARLLAHDSAPGEEVSDRLYRESIGVALAAHLLGGYAQAAPREARLSPRDERRLVEYIDAHLDRDLSLTKLARVVGLSGSHLKTLFRRSFGLPVHAYVVQRRVERARELLRESDLSITQVALEAGFSHPSHMARRMRLAIGLTPAQIRRGS